MNERINGLWWQARIGYNNQNCDPEVLAKFAELIVRDVVEQIITRERTDGEWYQDDIFKHFGVEE